MPPSHSLNQYWMIINEVLWYSSSGYFPLNAHNINPWYGFENYIFIIPPVSRRDNQIITHKMSLLYQAALFLDCPAWGPFYYQRLTVIRNCIDFSRQLLIDVLISIVMMAPMYYYNSLIFMGAITYPCPYISTKLANSFRSEASVKSFLTEITWFSSTVL